MNTLLILEQEATSPTTSPGRLRELAFQNDRLALLVAQNYHAPPVLLQDLARRYAREVYTHYLILGWQDDPNPNYNPVILKHLAENPNTPVETLLALGEDFPQELLDNPVFSLSYLEQPNLSETIPASTLKAILNLDRIPIFILKAALNSQVVEVRQQVARNVNTPVDFLKTLAIDAVAEVRSDVARNPHTPDYILGTLAQDIDSDVRQSVAQNLNTPPKLLLHLIAEFPQCFDDTFFDILILEHPELIMDEIPASTIRNLLEYQSTPRLILKIALKSQRIEVRRLLANSLNTPLDSLEILAQDTDDTVRLWVARNPKTPLSILKILSGDTHEQVRSKAMQRFEEKFHEPIAPDLKNFINHQIRLSINKNYAWHIPP